MSILPNIVKYLEDNGLGIINDDLFYTHIPYRKEGISLIERGGSVNSKVVSSQNIDVYAIYNNGNFARIRLNEFMKFFCSQTCICYLPPYIDCNTCEYPEYEGSVSLTLLSPLESLGKNENNNFVFRFTINAKYLNCLKGA